MGRSIVLQALASTIGAEELADLRDQFDAIDVDKNGAISLEEMRQALAKDLPWKLKESGVLEILQAVSLSFKNYIYKLYLDFFFNFYCHQRLSFSLVFLY
ncbi:hypothetical protein CsSME_00005931 [Camellia sinensis var. sinensis]